MPITDKQIYEWVYPDLESMLTGLDSSDDEDLTAKDVNFVIQMKNEYGDQAEAFYQRLRKITAQAGDHIVHKHKLQIIDRPGYEAGIDTVADMLTILYSTVSAYNKHGETSQRIADRINLLYDDAPGHSDIFKNAVVVSASAASQQMLFSKAARDAGSNESGFSLTSIAITAAMAVGAYYGYKRMKG